MKVRNHTIRTFTQAHQHMMQGDFLPTDLFESVWGNIEKGKHLNAWVTVKEKKALLKEFEKADERYKAG